MTTVDWFACVSVPVSLKRIGFKLMWAHRNMKRKRCASSEGRGGNVVTFGHTICSVVHKFVSLFVHCTGFPLFRGRVHRPPPKWSSVAARGVGKGPVRCYASSWFEFGSRRGGGGNRKTCERALSAHWLEPEHLGAGMRRGWRRRGRFDHPPPDRSCRTTTTTRALPATRRETCAPLPSFKDASVCPQRRRRSPLFSPPPPSILSGRSWDLLPSRPGEGSR